MTTDFLQNWLQCQGMSWWGIGLAYPTFALLIDVLLCLVFGGKDHLRDFVSDPVHFYWVVLILGVIPVVYTVNWGVTSATIASLALNGIDVLAWRHHFLEYTDSWLQWPILVLSLGLALSSFRRYAIVRQERTWFTKLPWPSHLLRTMLFDLPVAYLICMTVVNLIDSTIALNRVFVHIPSAIAVDTWQLDGLYGLEPAYKLLLGQFGVGLLVSFLPALMLRREAKQSYSSMYRAGVLIGIAIVVAVTSIVLYNFSNAVGRVKISALMTIADSLRVFQPRLTELLQEIRRTNLLVEYQIAASLPSSLPIPGWLAVLGASRVLLLAMEFYSLLRPTLRTPKIPDILRRLIEI